MNEKIKLDIKDSVADTLFITLYAKAVETQKDDPLIFDKKACELVNQIDYNFSKYKNASQSTVGVVIRANHFDKMVHDFIKNNSEPVVLLLGCGLDSRYQRLGEIANKAQFYELDLEEVIETRHQLIPPASNEVYIGKSIFHTDWMDKITEAHPDGQYIIVIEGVLMYFTEADNKQILTTLAQKFKGAEIHIDVLNEWMSKNSAKHDTVKKTNASFNFGVDDLRTFETWHDDIQLKRAYNFHEFKGWRRMGFMTSLFMPIIPVLKTSSRLVHLKIK